MSSQSLSIMDLRNTLPNLRYLLLYITSGNGPVCVPLFMLSLSDFVYPPILDIRNTNYSWVRSVERERPSSSFIKILRRNPSERSPNENGSINGRSASPASHTRRVMSLDIPKRDFVDISDLSKGEVVYSTTRFSNGNGIGR